MLCGLGVGSKSLSQQPHISGRPRLVCSCSPLPPVHALHTEGAPCSLGLPQHTVCENCSSNSFISLFKIDGGRDLWFFIIWYEVVKGSLVWNVSNKKLLWDYWYCEIIFIFVLTVRIAVVVVMVVELNLYYNSYFENFIDKGLLIVFKIFIALL